MGTFDDLGVGDTFVTPERALTQADAEALIRIGGYTHPLFTDPAFAAASRFGKVPLPGQAVLLVMGGLVEQTDRFDETVIALVGFEQVRVRAPAFAGDPLSVRVSIADKQQGAGRGLLIMVWNCMRGDEVLVEARARMIFRIDAQV